MSRRVALSSLFAVLLAGFVPGGWATGGAWQDVATTLDGAVSAESLTLDGAAPRLATVTPQETVGFASCDTQCLDPDRWSVLAGGLGEGVGSVSVTMAAGIPVVAFAEAGGRVAVAACSRNCNKPGSWTTSDVDTASAGTTVSLAGDGGTLHLAYTKNGQLQYGRCCIDGAWTTLELAQSGASRPALVVEDGLPRLAYVDAVEGGERLRYLACAAQLCTGADWAGTAVGAATASLGRPSLAANGNGARLVVDASDGGSARTLQWLECQKACTDAKSWTGPTALAQGADAPSLVLTGAAGKARLGFVECQECGTVLESRDVVVGTCEATCTEPNSWSFATVAGATGSSGVSLQSTGAALRAGFGTGSGDGPAHFACDSGCSTGSASPTTTTTAPGAGGGGGDGDGGGTKVLGGDAAAGGQGLRAPNFNAGLDLGQGRRPRGAIAVDDETASGVDDATRGGPVPVGGGAGSGSGVPPWLGVVAALMLSGVAWLIPRAARAQVAASAPLLARVVD